jgi:hypothetical protein
MLAYCGRPRSASFCDRFPYICVGYARETIAETCSIWVALATAIIGHSGSRAALFMRTGHARARDDFARIAAFQSLTMLA